MTFWRDKGVIRCQRFSGYELMRVSRPLETSCQLHVRVLGILKGAHGMQQ